MENLRFIFGPVPSRRLGRSLGISPIPRKTCNYSCIYCQLGRTNKMTNTRQEFFKVEDILNEFKIYLKDLDKFDIITIVGEGEPTLYSKLGELITELKKLTDKPIAVITNGSLFSDKNVSQELLNADFVLPSLDAYNEELYKKIDRPHGNINFKKEIEGLINFSNIYKGNLWLEIMLIDNINCDKKSISNFKKLLKKIKYDRLYLNTPVRPPAEDFVQTISKEDMEYASKELKGISIDMLSSGFFFSEIGNPTEAIFSIIRRHPMNQFELESFLKSRKVKNIHNFIKELENNDKINVINYKGIKTYKLK
ncbi:radical SAM protein [Fusobacterium sp. MFO224]|uniref:radical SAM protein n=1 Tax=Fusobacterium sp. MFO224 TaxID=3378070 RepID=UPI003853CFCD